MGCLFGLLSGLSCRTRYFPSAGGDNNGDPDDNRGLYEYHVELLFRRYRKKKTFFNTVVHSNGIVHICNYTVILVRRVSHLGVFKALFIPMAEGLIVTSLFRLSDYRGRATAYSGFAIWGSVGWAIATALAGVAAWVFGITAVFYLASLLFVVATIVYLRVPEPREIEGFPKTSARSSVRPRIITSYFAPIRELLTNKKMVILLLASLPLFAAINAASRFFPIYLESSGASPILIGLAFTFPAILEIPVFLYAGKLSDKIGARKPLLIFSAAVYSLLFFLVLLTSNPVLLLLIHSLLTPFAWAPLITGSSTLVSEIVPRDKWVTGQNLFTIWLWSIGGIIGSLIGGFTSDAWGLPVMFAIASVFALVSGIFFRGVREK